MYCSLPPLYTAANVHLSNIHIRDGLGAKLSTYILDSDIVILPFPTLFLITKGTSSRSRSRDTLPAKNNVVFILLGGLSIHAAVYLFHFDCVLEYQIIHNRVPQSYLKEPRMSCRHLCFLLSSIKITLSCTKR